VGPRAPVEGEIDMSSVPELTTATFEDSVKDGVTLIDFWAEWCGPCKMIAPMIDELATEYSGKAKVAKINVDNEAELAAKFRVNSIPTLLIIKDGQEAKRFVGVTPKTELAGALDAAGA
jgi:thioredoxin 1